MSIERTTRYRRTGLAADPGEERAAGEGAQAGPGQEEAERFAGLLRSAPPGETVLAGLKATAPPPEAGPAAAVVGELAERLLVSDEAGPGSVRVVAKEVGIPGLEVAVRREGGRLRVELLADLAPDLALLRGHAGELARHLEARFGVPAEIAVRRREPGWPGEAP